VGVVEPVREVLQDGQLLGGVDGQSTDTALVVPNLDGGKLDEWFSRGFA
jgi:hypothetical protein